MKNNICDNCRAGKLTKEQKPEVKAGKGWCKWCLSNPWRKK